MADQRVALTPLSSSSPVAAIVVEADQLHQAVADWLANYTAGETGRAYRSDLIIFLRWLASQDEQPTLFEVTRRHIMRWRDEQSKEMGLAAHTVNRRRDCISSLYKSLVRDGLMAHNPAEGVRSLPVASESPRTPLTDHQVRILLLQPDRSTFTGLRDHAQLQLLLRLGLRASTVAGLTVGALGFENGYRTLYVVSKGGADKRYPLPVDVAESLNDYLAVDNREWVWQHVTGEGADYPIFPALKKNGVPHSPRRPMSYKQVWRMVARYAVPAGLAPLDVHTLRVTFATNASEHGADLYDLMDAMMHKKVDTTRGYVKRGESLKRSVVHLVTYGEE